MISYVTELTDNNYKEFIRNGLVLVDIWAKWCGPCRQISPIIDALSSDYVGRVSVGKLDADIAPETLGELGVRSIPTILLYKNNEVIERLVGTITKQKLSEIIENNL